MTLLIPRTRWISSLRTGSAVLLQAGKLQAKLPITPSNLLTARAQEVSQEVRITQNLQQNETAAIAVTDTSKNALRARK